MVTKILRTQISEKSEKMIAEFPNYEVPLVKQQAELALERIAIHLAESTTRVEGRPVLQFDDVDIFIGEFRRAIGKADYFLANYPPCRDAFEVFRHGDRGRLLKLNSVVLTGLFMLFF